MYCKSIDGWISNIPPVNVPAPWLDNFSLKDRCNAIELP